MSSTVIDVEDRLRFEFADRWLAIAWDKAEEYVGGLAKESTTAAVDIVAVRDESRLCLIEVKDPRGHRIPFKAKAADLPNIAADKARDTFAAAIWAADRTGLGSARLGRLLRTLFVQRAEKLVVVLWLEGTDDPAVASALIAKLEARLGWMKPKVVVTSRRLSAAHRSSILDGLTVSSLPGAPSRP